MDGIISLLPGDYYERILNLWDTINKKFGLSGLSASPFPHMTWLLAEDIDPDLVKSCVNEEFRKEKPIQIVTEGLAMFREEKHIIYLPIIKPPKLSTLHQKLWSRIIQNSGSVSEQYHPDRWMPHITLVYEDKIEKRLDGLCAWLLEEDLDWEMELDTLSIFSFEPQTKLWQEKARIDL